MEVKHCSILFLASVLRQTLMAPANKEEFSSKGGLKIKDAIATN
jgi:hypothetical protein